MIYGYSLCLDIYFCLHKNALINAGLICFKTKKILVKISNKVVFHCLIILTSVSFLVMSGKLCKQVIVPLAFTAQNSPKVAYSIFKELREWDTFRIHEKAAGVMQIMEMVRELPMARQSKKEGCAYNSVC